MLTGVRDILKPQGIVVFTVEALGQGLEQGQGLGLELEQGIKDKIGQKANVEPRVGAGLGDGLGVAEERQATDTPVAPLSFALQPSGRIAHGRQYIERVVQEVGV